MSRRPATVAIALICCSLASAAIADDGTHISRRVAKAAGPADETMGFVPPPFDADHYADATALTLRADKALPAAFDCRAQGWLTPVRNQGSCGACYAFGAAGDLESKLLKDGVGTLDLSENAMKECTFEGSSCNGGNQFMVMNQLSVTGAVLEGCDPYVALDVACASGCDAQVVVLDWSAVSGGTVPATAVLKQYLMDHGPLQTTLYAGDASDMTWYSTLSSYNGASTLYYAPNPTPNHSVVLVGWDDSLVHAGGTGAWIVRNSWGSSWGGTCGYGAEEGYFTIAYGSASIGMWSSFVGEYMIADPGVKVLRHDEAGYTSSYGGLGTTLWGMARHVSVEDTYLHRVEFWLADAATDVDVYVYDSFGGGSLSSLLSSSLNHSFAEPGYHYVELPGPLALSTGQDFYIAMRITTQSSLYPVAVDMSGPPANGTSWYSFNGSTWTSLDGTGADVTIRARTGTDTVLAIEDDGPQDLPDAVVPGTGPRLDAAWPNPFNPSTNIRCYMPREGYASLIVYDLQGHHIRTLVDGNLTGGDHTSTWDGRDDSGAAAPAGVYFALLEAFDQTRSTKLALLK